MRIKSAHFFQSPLEPAIATEAVAIGRRREAAVGLARDGVCAAKVEVSLVPYFVVGL